MTTSIVLKYKDKHSKVFLEKTDNISIG